MVAGCSETGLGALSLLGWSALDSSTLGSGEDVSSSLKHSSVIGSRVSSAAAGSRVSSAAAGSSGCTKGMIRGSLVVSMGTVVSEVGAQGCVSYSSPLKSKGEADLELGEVDPSSDAGWGSPAGMSGRKDSIIFPAESGSDFMISVPGSRRGSASTAGGGRGSSSCSPASGGGRGCNSCPPASGGGRGCNSMSSCSTAEWKSSSLLSCSAWGEPLDSVGVLLCLP